jgi:hypothetical protein
MDRRDKAVWGVVLVCTILWLAHIHSVTQGIKAAVAKPNSHFTQEDK